MHIRLLFLVALFSVSIFSGHGIRHAHASYCTVADIMEAFYEGASQEEVQADCDVLDVTTCDAGRVYTMIEDGYSLSEIYGACS